MRKKGIFWSVIGVHLLFSLVFTLMSSITHPLLALVKTWPLYGQIILACIFSFVLYIIPGYILVISLSSNEKLIENVDRIMIAFTLVLIVVFLISFANAIMLHSRQGWLIYATFNPVSGLLIYNLFDKLVTWWDLFWVFTSLMPGLGMMLGMYLRLKKEGSVR